MRSSRNGYPISEEPAHRAPPVRHAPASLAASPVARKQQQQPPPSPAQVGRPAMNGRVFAVNRSPVLAWNVEAPPPVPPFADMPAAAAAAISPADPYGRCGWQGQVDPGTGYPYFGTLYSNSLPSPAYRLQPGCMANLGQFWPPTPPPDGCGRFDGSNLYFAPPVTPVLRHGENVPQNLRNSFQGLGHYSHLVETPKESPSNQRTFKQECSASQSVSVPSLSMCSSVAKSDNISTYCVVDSKLKPLDSIISRSSKQDPHHSVSIGHESFSCVPDSRTSSNSHPSAEKECFSPPYSLKSTLFHNSSQDISISKPKSTGLESSCNASPLKNVYFSHFESENVNPLPSKNFSSKHYEGQYVYEHKNNEPIDSKHLKLPHHTVANNAYLAHNVYASSKKYDFHTPQELCSVSPSYSTPNRSERTADRLALLSEQCRQQSNFYKVKPEKSTSHSDCKYQKQSSKRSSSVVHVADYRSLKDVFNIPTSQHVHPKIEPNDKYFLPNCSATTQSCMTANSYINSGPPLLVSKDFASDPRISSGYQCWNSCSLGKPWQLNGLPIMSHPDSYFKTPEAAKPPMAPPNMLPHEGLISVAQTAPEVLRGPAKFSPTNPCSTRRHEDIDDEVQVIAVQTKLGSSSSSKHNSRKSVESRSSSSQCIVPNQVFCLKTEKDQEPNSAFSPSMKDQTRKSHLNNTNNHPTPPPPLLSVQQPGPTFIKDYQSFSVQSKACDLSTSNIKQGIDPQEKTNFAVVDVKPQIVTETVEAKNRHDAINQARVMPIESESLPELESSESLHHPVKTFPDQDVGSTTVNVNQNENDSVISSIKSEVKSMELDSSPPSLECQLVLDDIKAEQDDLDRSTTPPICTYNENHGLHLLLDTIEKVASLNSLERLDDPSTSNNESTAENKTTELQEDIAKANDSFASEISLCGLETSNARGLDLLSAIAGQRFLTEFDGVKCEPEDSSHIESNYPEVKKEMQEVQLCVEEVAKGSADSSAVLSPSSVFEMRDRLVELQKKYKQKQKELSRLKPKKMLACSYLRERQRKLSSCESVQSSETLSNFSTCSNPEMTITVSSSEDAAASNEELPSHESATKSDGESAKSIKDEARKSMKERRSLKRKLRDLRIKSNLRSSVSEETLVTSRPRTRRSIQAISNSQIKDDECVEVVEIHKKSTRNPSSNNKELSASGGETPTVVSRVRLVSKDSLKTDPSCENLNSATDKSKNYTLRKNLHGVKRCKVEQPSDMADNSATTHSKTITSKRKSDNPKKYMPSKQSKLSETIVAKHLRNRILFDTSGTVSDDDNQKDYGVPDDLYDALMKCHLSEENKAIVAELPSKADDNNEFSGGQLGCPEASRIKAEHLVEKHRLLAIEDGLMYAGCIKEIQSPDRFGVALDGQRGNRLHIFTREELLTQTITESKPISSELPEGTRVCAYWSQQYRCLYPGVVGKAPCPSADWSEPRVFVLFDDGDSGQIPIKNIRLIPADVFPSEEENQQSETSSFESTDGSKSKCSGRGIKSRRLRSSRKHSRPKRQDVQPHGNDCKESSCTSINDSSCDDSCFNDPSISPSQTTTPEHLDSNNGSTTTLTRSSNNTDAKFEKRLRKHSKRKTGRAKEADADKGKRHRRYKDKHKHHHHHHHHHRHHHHHHHHSKKRKHRSGRHCNGSKVSSSTSGFSSQDVALQQEIIPTCSAVASKRRKNQCDSAVDLPQTE